MKKVLITGHFNVVHAGHIRLFKYAKNFANNLIVAVENDKLAKNKAIIKEKLRLDGVKNIGIVNQAFLYGSNIERLIKKIKPDFILKGKEHENKNNPEEKILKKYGGKIIFSSGDIVFSSKDFINLPKQNERKKFNLPNNFLNRHGLEEDKLFSLIEKFNKKKVCVIGDVIIDQYVETKALGMSNEDPTIVVTPTDKVNYIGGSAIVAAHSSSLGANTHLISVTGKDDSKKFLIKKLKKIGVTYNLFEDESRPTTLKRRYRANNKTLLRVSKLIQSSISKKIENEILKKIKILAKNLDVIIFSDFNYGCISDDLVLKVSKIAKKYGVLLFADSQSSSQTGNISRFKNMDLIFATEREARLALSNKDDGLVVLAEKLKLKSKCKNLFIKLAEDGLLIHAYRKNKRDWLTDKINSLNHNPRDVNGAGDAMMVVSVLAYVSGANIWETALLGSLGSAIQINKIGNTPISIKELSKEVV